MANEPNKTAALVCFSHDLRLADNPALSASIEPGLPVIPVFIWSPEEEGEWLTGGASQWWLHQSLTALQNSLRSLGSNLIIRRGPALETMLSLAAESNARHIFWNRRYEPHIIERNRALKEGLQQHGLLCQSFNGSLLFEPSTIHTANGGAYKVFTPFWRACLTATPPSQPIQAPSRIPAPASWPQSIAISDLDLEPEVDWATGIRKAWTPGERGASERLKIFVDDCIEVYASDRDRPDHEGTSRLSPYLHFGEISPRQIWHATRQLQQAEPYLRQLVWREFAYHLLYHFPETTQEPFRREFRDFPWKFNEHWLRAWASGATGYPIVDAGMRQLWQTGWMHNRVRMVGASFLVKHLLIPWQEGAAWFWDTLVDADLANNTLGWQWVAGCGADAAPYFRVFNPILQGQKFDPDGDYVRRWVPELSLLPDDYIHQPWVAPANVLAAARVELGVTYPLPLVEHSEARNLALKAFSTLTRLHARR